MILIQGPTSDNKPWTSEWVKPSTHRSLQQINRLTSRPMNNSLHSSTSRTQATRLPHFHSHSTMADTTMSPLCSIPNPASPLPQVTNPQSVSTSFLHCKQVLMNFTWPTSPYQCSMRMASWLSCTRTLLQTCRKSMTFNLPLQTP